MSETHDLESFRRKFRVQELLVLEAGAWSWSVRPGQPTLGAGVLSLNRHALQLSEVTPAEMAELAGLVKEVETRLNAAFDYRIMNYLMLMMVDHHVHYHLVPRYEGPRSFAGLEWVDNGWPALPQLGDNQHAARPQVLGQIRDALRG